MENGYSLSDIANAAGGFGGNNEFIWIFALLILFGGGGFGWNRNNGEFGQFATAASQNELLLGQKFDALSRQINQVGDGLCSSTYALNNAIQGEGRAIQTQLCAINSNIDNKFAALEKSQLEQTINAQANQISQLQLAQAMCGVPKISTYAWGTYPYNSCGCGLNNNI